ncbi:tetratricopeptide repeat protein [Desulfonatronovibrio hydrogenovorans]|uniref:tetratricopeptide repeat protein n=1 Tax=Desulfonatronovibrio hydrogenovorans TaxID=53245 RepID=UPI00048BCCB9|nr:tetratricopeptide repeat protein [Desulfonatronovibrio hydrogenovorans]
MIHKTILFFYILALPVFSLVMDAEALEYYWGRHPEHERIVFEFSSLPAEFQVDRTGMEEISLVLPGDIWETEERPSEIDFRGSGLFRNVRISGSSLIIRTTTDAFGYISFTLPAENKIVVDVYRDPLGSRWVPAPRPAVTAPLSRPEQAGPDPQPEPAEPDPVTDLSVEEPEPRPAHQVRTAIQRISPEEAGVALPAEPQVQAAREPVVRPDPSEIEEPPSQEVLHPDLESPEDIDEWYEELLFAAMAHMSGGDYRSAVGIFESVINDPNLPEKYMEEAFYSYAEANFQMLRHDIRGNFQRILLPFERAINYDPDSRRLPTALLNIGYIHLQVGNEPEARGYFNLLRQRYPHHASIPATYFYWGDYYYRHGRFQEAADSFQHVVQEYPEDQLVKPSAVNLARTLSEMDFDSQALDILEYVESRWPRHYIDDPDFLILSGYILYRNNRLDQAKDRFLLYANLIPDGDQVDVSMARIGDIYLLQENRSAAREMYEETVRQYPDEEGGLIASMRLAEEGIYDEPSISDMFNVFDRPFTLRPKQIYTRISEEYPDSPLAPVALIKLAMWELFQGEQQAALEAVDRFHQRYTHKDLWPRAHDLGFEILAELVAEKIKDQDYQEVVEVWEEFAFLNEYPEKLDHQTRLALATAYWNREDLEQALTMARPFLEDPEAGRHSHAALSLILGIHLETADWGAILDLAHQVEEWDLSEDKKLQMDYANALALQNLDRADEALPLWRRLAVETDFPGRQRAFVLYFLAQDAQHRQDLQNVYIFAQEALALFMDQEEKDLTRIRTCLDMLMQATSRTGRAREALGWALEYDNYIDRDDPDWPAFRYRLASMYRLNQDFEQWERVLTELIESHPQDVFSRMARSDLNSHRLLRQADQYRP